MYEITNNRTKTNCNRGNALEPLVDILHVCVCVAGGGGGGGVGVGEEWGTYTSFTLAKHNPLVWFNSKYM